MSVEFSYNADLDTGSIPVTSTNFINKYMKSILEEYKVLLDNFHDIVKNKKQWVDLAQQPIKSKIIKDLDIKKNIFNLVNFAYTTSLNEPHAGVKSYKDVLSSTYTYWEAIDVDSNPDADAVIFGQKRNGIKLSGIGHNGKLLSIEYLLNKLVKLLQTGSYWIEASAKVAKILKREGLPIMGNFNKVKKLFPKSEILQKFDDGSYIRTLSGGKRTQREYIFGNPQL